MKPQSRGIFHIQIARLRPLDLSGRAQLALPSRYLGCGSKEPDLVARELEIKLELSIAKVGRCGARDSENADRSGAGQNMGVRGLPG